MPDNTNLMQVTDVNNKEFTININDFVNFNEDSHPSAQVTNRKKNLLPNLYNTRIFDSTETEIDTAPLIADIKSGKSDITSLDVYIEATHSGSNKNCEIYKSSSMAEDAETFINPFHKPLLKNHNDFSGEPIGRIMDAECKDSVIADGRSTILVKASVTDQDAILKFLDGRYRTVSIGASVNNVVCNTCGKQIYDGTEFKFCGHMRGQAYKGEVCNWIFTDLSYNELSVVNCPADDFAQIVKIVVNKSSNKKTKGEPDMVDGQKDQNSLTNNDAASIIDNVLGQTPTNNQTQEPAPKVNNAQGAGDFDPDNPENQKITDLNNQIKELQQKLQDAEKRCEDATTQLAALNINLEDAKKQSDYLNEKCVALAIDNKRMLVDKLMDLENKPFGNEADRLTYRDGLLQKSAKEITSAIDTIKNSRNSSANIPQIENPGLVDTSKDGSKEITDSENKSEQSNIRHTVQDHVNQILNKIYSK